jgi:predicted transcriptional regulator
LSQKEIVIEHETRRMIYEHILAHPGVSFNILKQVFGLKDGTLRYHLDYLKKKEKIIFSKGKRCYYPTRSETVVFQMKNNKMESHFLSPLQSQILNIIKERPGINQKELVKKIGLNRFTVNNNLKKLMELCIIRKTSINRMVCYEYITKDQLQTELLMNIIIKLLNKEIDEKTFLELKDKLE